MDKKLQEIERLRARLLCAPPDACARLTARLASLIEGLGR